MDAQYIAREMNQIPCTIERLTEPDKLLIGTRCSLVIFLQTFDNLQIKVTYYKF